LQEDFDLAWYGKGLALNQHGRLAEALEAFDAALAINAQGVLAWFHKAETLQALERHDEARAAFEQVLELSSSSHPLYNQAQKKLQAL
jgi:tetratricopeptide (TPR) repeat protein